MGLFDNIHERLNEALRAAHQEEASALAGEGMDIAKADLDDRDPLKRNKKTFNRAALVDPNLSAYYGGGGFGLYKPRFSHISFKTLKEMSIRDPIVATILQTRINQIAAFTRPQASRYDTGFKIIPIDPELDIEPGSREEEEIKFLTDFICNTGIVDEHRDPDDYMSFDTWLKVVMRDRLTYGAAAIETVRDFGGRIHSFLPVPTETVFYANKAISDEMIDHSKIVNKQTYFEHGREGVPTLDAERLKRGEYEFVQVIEGRVVEGFTKEQMIYKLGNPQNFIDNNGYCLGELEMATTTITAHMQAENYNKLFFTHGFAARGLLHIKGDVTPSQLQAFRAQWYSQVSGNANSWRTPILAGVDDIQWIQLAANNRDMEYVAYVDHIIRVLCGMFQMSPMECGFDYLIKGSGQKSLGEANNEWKLQEAKDRGLRPLLVWAEALINDEVLPGVDPQMAEKYKFSFVGLNAESRQEELERHRAEMTLHTSIDDIRKEIDKDPIVGGKIILNPDYIQFMLRTHTVGEIREKLLGYDNDASNELFDYIADGPYLQNRMEVTGIGAPQPGGGGPVGPDGQPVPVDENGQPVGPDGQPLSPEEAAQMGIQMGQPQGMPGQPVGPDGQPMAPGGEQEPQPGMGGDMIEQSVLEYLNDHPELVEKSLIKSAETNNLNSFHENLRTDYMKVFQDVQRKMLKEVLEEVKEDLDGESESRPADEEDSADN